MSIRTKTVKYLKTQTEFKTVAQIADAIPRDRGVAEESHIMSIREKLCKLHHRHPKQIIRRLGSPTVNSRGQKLLEYKLNE